jgi:hypothetical protein
LSFLGLVAGEGVAVSMKLKLCARCGGGGLGVTGIQWAA